MTISVPFNHEVVMVKIRSVFQLILAVYFMAFYFTKTHFLTLMLTMKFHLLAIYKGSAPGPCRGFPSIRPSAISPNHGDRSTPTLGLLQLGIKCRALYYSYLPSTHTGFHCTVCLHTAASCNRHVCFS